MNPPEAIWEIGTFGNSWVQEKYSRYMYRHKLIYLPRDELDRLLHNNPQTGHDRIELSLSSSQDSAT